MKAPDTYESRAKELASLRRQESLDAIIVYSDVWRCGNTQYFTGWWPTGGGISQASVFLILGPDDNLSLLVGFEQVLDAKERVPFARVGSSEDLAKLLTLIKPRARRVGLVGLNILPFSYMNLVRESLGNVEFVDLTPRMVEWRRIKVAWEIERLREAAECSDKAILAALNSLRAGVSEEEVMAAGLQAIGSRGGIPSFLPVVGFGRNSSIPMRFPSQGTTLGSASIVLLDFGARVRGYAGDISRTVLVGSVSAREKEIVDVAIRANEAAVRAIQPGLRSSEVNGKVKEIIAAAGFGSYIAHDSSHGVGIDHEEDFPLKPGNDFQLKKNMVFTVEAGIYVPELGGVRIEDTVVVQEDSCEVLSSLPHEMKAL